MQIGLVVGWIAAAAFVGTFIISLFGRVYGLFLRKGALARICGRVLSGLVVFVLAWLTLMIAGLFDRLNDAFAVALLLVLSVVCTMCTVRVFDIWSKETLASRANK